MSRGVMHHIAESSIVFDPDYQAILDSATTSGYSHPSMPYKLIQNQFMIDLKIYGILPLLDELYIMRDDASINFNTLNWKSPADKLELLDTNIYKATVDNDNNNVNLNFWRTAMENNNGRMRSPYNYDDNLKRSHNINESSFGYDVLTEGSPNSGTRIVWLEDSSTYSIWPRELNGDTQFAYHRNSRVNTGFGNYYDRGFKLYNRISNPVVESYLNGQLVATTNIPINVTPLMSTKPVFLKNGTGALMNMYILYMGQKMTYQQVSDFNTSYQTYLTSVNNI